MAENSAIEWTDHTFNPWMGCTKVSPGCDHCYAEARQDKRLHVVQWGAGQPRKRTSPANWKLPETWNDRHHEFVAKHGRRQRVFCASLADVFDNEVDPRWRADLFFLIEQTPNLDWLLLTKRIGNVQRMVAETSELLAVVHRPLAWPLPNVWLGASIVNQAEADRDVVKLLDTPARIRFLSMEPLLGAVDLRFCSYHTTGDPWDDNRFTLNLNALSGFRGTSQVSGEQGPRLDWVIAGGESGPGARPAHPDWFRSLRDQCAAHGVKYLFKQWGEWVSVSEVEGAGAHFKFPDGATVRRIGKKAAGRTLDGVTHDGAPA